jgi:hypothetical protein
VDGHFSIPLVVCPVNDELTEWLNVRPLAQPLNARITASPRHACGTAERLPTPDVGAQELRAGHVEFSREFIGYRRAA